MDNLEAENHLVHFAYLQQIWKKSCFFQMSNAALLKEIYNVFKEEK
jgi:hypothetical protein